MDWIKITVSELALGQAIIENLSEIHIQPDFLYKLNGDFIVCLKVLLINRTLFLK